jgi:transcriptional regulator with XRE-family HTH domain
MKMLLAGEDMNLKDYIFLNRMSVNEFAKKIKCSCSYFSLLLNGHIKPRKRLAQDIEEATEGKVKAEELMKGE